VAVLGRWDGEASFLTMVMGRDQAEHYFVVRTSVQEISSDRWTEEERQVIVEHRW
jgi:hypothetical protein